MRPVSLRFNRIELELYLHLGRSTTDLAAQNRCGTEHNDEIEEENVCSTPDFSHLPLTLPILEMLWFVIDTFCPLRCLGSVLR
jgi:hypothetical protein